MINLIPPERKEAIRFARRNATLVQWLTGAGIALAGLLIITAGSLFFLNRGVANLQKSIDTANLNLKQQKETETLAAVSEISGNLDLTVKVLEREILFSNLLEHIGNLMPKGTVLQDLALDNQTTDGLDLTIIATSYDAASQALANLRDDEGELFKDAEVNRIDCSDDDPDEDDDYGCTATIRTVLHEKSPFLFLQKGANQ